MPLKSLMDRAFFTRLRQGLRGHLQRRRRRWMVAAGLLLAVLALDRIFALPQPGRDSPYALTVVARDGTPLRAFPDKAHIWRYPVRLEEVSPYYVEALIGFEDRAFRWHPGINPLAMLRAGWQWLSNGRIVSGGSTITMQVARIVAPTSHTLAGKLAQCLRALQLELHYSKKEILTLYLNYAPMGGVLEGVEAASRAYLGKPAARLTHAEAALLTVLPQQPSSLRPDRYARRAQVARDKVLQRMQGRWSQAVIQDALSEPVIAQTLREPMLAPLLAQRMKQQLPGKLRIDTTIDPTTQLTVETLLADRIHQLPPRVSMAAMVMDNSSFEVLAYAGSADFSDRQRFSDVDMVRASRSPGSALKPFLYAFALDEGLIHSESLLSDTPQSFSGYQPGNFQQNFHGPVSVSEALVKSLNVPAVQVLEQLGPEHFVSMLRRGGLKLSFPRGASPNLSVILGGAGARLEDMVAAYSSLARKGMAATPRFTPNAARQEVRMMSEGAAFIVRDILETGGPVARMVENNGAYRGMAWKTGTSFGFRDAWAVGVGGRYTVGVWVGRPDGTPNPGFFGANVAAPLLVDILSGLPDGRNTSPQAAPPGVAQERICWPLGTRLEEGMDSKLCPVQRTAWTLAGAAPPTFPDRIRNAAPIERYLVDHASGLRVGPGCIQGQAEERQSARWPAALEPWLEQGMRQTVLPPDWSPACAGMKRSSEGVKIAGMNDGEVIQSPTGKSVPRARLEIRGTREMVNWMVNGKLVARKAGTQSQLLEFPTPGRYDITAFDEQGRYDRISVSVQAAQ